MQEVLTKDKLKTLLINSKMSGRQFAKFIGVSYETIRCWTSGRNKPSYVTIRKIQKAFLRKGITLGIEDIVSEE